MRKDMCILVNPSDQIVGHASKLEAHSFVSGTPYGRLHRAFSVFLFDHSDRLLLQQRAPSKITFPSVWTNTCCSHQLYGCHPPEVDSDDDIRTGTVPGAKFAAVRKLEHELGIPRGAVPTHAFRFLTRLHYCAADTATHGPNSPWGEHEIDYILLARTDSTSLPVTPHPEEVDDTKWVTPDQLREMMKPESGLTWSPWFRAIVDKFLWTWWADLPRALDQLDDHFLDVDHVHRVLVTDEVLADASRDRDGKGQKP